MERCKTCKYWTPTNGNFPSGDRRKPEGDGGQCHHDKLAESWGPDSYSNDALVYPYSEGAKTFWTGPNFGCVHHEQA